MLRLEIRTAHIVGHHKRLALVSVTTNEALLIEFKLAVGLDFWAIAGVETALEKTVSLSVSASVMTG